MTRKQIAAALAQIEAAFLAVTPEAERAAVDAATKHHVAHARSFVEFVESCKGGYAPSIYTRPIGTPHSFETPEHFASATVLADAFDRVMERLGDSRRAYRGFNAADLRHEARVAARAA